MSAPGKRRTRHSEILGRHKRRAKIAKLRLRLKTAKSESERKLILQKMKRIVRLGKLPEL